MKLKDLLKVITCEVVIYNEDWDVLVRGQEFKKVFPYLDSDVSEVGVPCDDNVINVVICVE